MGRLRGTHLTAARRISSGPALNASGELVSSREDPRRSGLNIAFVNNQYQLGGAETVVHQLRAGLAQAGHVSHLHVAQGKTYPVNDGVVPLYPRWLSRLSHSRAHPLVERLFPRGPWTDRAFRQLANDSADLIHVHNFHGDYARVPSLAGLARAKPLVWTFHAFWGITGGCDHPKSCERYQGACGQCPQLGKWPLGRVDRTADQLQQKLRWWAGLPLHVVAPSRHLAARVRASQVGRGWHVHHIPNGVDPARFSFARKRDPQFRASLGLRPASTVILVANRNFRDAEKGFPMARQALEMMPSGPVQVVLAGLESDWAAAQLSPQAECLSLGYVASRQKMAELYEAADIFLFASQAENFPCVILEAMSAKCCVVATPTGGVVEQIEPGRTGLLAGHISGKSLGLSLREALAAPEQCRIYGEQARREVEAHFSEERMVQRHLDLYARMISTSE